MPVAKILQGYEEEPNSLTRRINKSVKSQERRGQVTQSLIKFQEKMKSLFDNKVKDKSFQPGDLVLKWDVRREDKSRHGEFYPLWFVHFKIDEENVKNTFLLENLDGEVLELSINGQILKLYFQH